MNNKAYSRPKCLSQAPHKTKNEKFRVEFFGYVSATEIRSGEFKWFHFLLGDRPLSSSMCGQKEGIRLMPIANVCIKLWYLAGIIQNNFSTAHEGPNNYRSLSLYLSGVQRKPLVIRGWPQTENVVLLISNSECASCIGNALVHVNISILWLRWTYLIMAAQRRFIKRHTALNPND